MLLMEQVAGLMLMKCGSSTGPAQLKVEQQWFLVDRTRQVLYSIHSISLVHIYYVCTGFATRECLSGAIWGAADVSLCESTLIANIKKMVGH